MSSKKKWSPLEMLVSNVEADPFDSHGGDRYLRKRRHGAFGDDEANTVHFPVIENMRRQGNLRQITPAMAARLSQKPCKYFMNGFCGNGDNCLYSHDTTIYPCREYHAFGDCEMDQACPFSHEDIIDEHDLTQFVADNKDFLELNKRELGDTVVADYYRQFCQGTSVDLRLTGNFSGGEHSGEEENQQDRANQASRRSSNQNSLASIVSLVSSKPVKAERKPSKDRLNSTPKNNRNVGARYREDARGPHNTNSMFEMVGRKRRNISEDSSPERAPMFSGEKNENSQPLRDIRNGSRGAFQDEVGIRRDNSQGRSGQPFEKANGNLFKSNFFVKDSSLDFLKLAPKEKSESGIVAPKDALAKDDSSTASKEKNSNTSSPAQIQPPKPASRTNSGQLFITRPDPRLVNSRDPRESRDAKEAKDKEAKEKETREALERGDSSSLPLPAALTKEVSNKSDPGEKVDFEKKLADKLKTLGILKKAA